PGPEYARNFDENVHLSTEREIAAFLERVHGDLLESMSGYLRAGEATTDEPSRLLLEWCVGLASQQVEALRRWSDGSVRLRSVDAPSAGPGLPYSGKEPLPQGVSVPRRREGLQFEKESILRPIDRPIQALVIHPESMRRLCHFVYLDIEVQAMEVCALNIILFREMPLQFKLDMARQIWDEGRHAILLRQLLEKYGGREGDYAYGRAVWNRYFLGDTLAERLAIQQIVQEGNSVEGNAIFIQQLREAGETEAAELLEYVNADESVHVRIGNEWLLHLVEHSRSEYEASIKRAMGKIGVNIPGKAPINKRTRAISAFPMWFIDSLA
ncbi:MAG: ferritin-like domain-containing protein, partial [Archangium sp.]